MSINARQIMLITGLLSFFLSCSELFRLNNGNEWWVSHYRFENRKLPTAVDSSQFDVAIA